MISHAFHKFICNKSRVRSIKLVASQVVVNCSELNIWQDQSLLVCDGWCTDLSGRITGASGDCETGQHLTLSETFYLLLIVDEYLLLIVNRTSLISCTQVFYKIFKFSLLNVSKAFQCKLFCRKRISWHFLAFIM